MAGVIDKAKLDNLTGEIWKSAQRLRGKFKPNEYQNVVLPLIVIRRLECVLLQWRDEKRAEIRAMKPKLSDRELDKLVRALEQNQQQSPFSNKTKWTLRSIYDEDHALLDEHFRTYINGFSANVLEIIDHFNYKATIGLMAKYNRLAPLLNQYKELDLGPDRLSNLEMGYVYEEMLKRFSEQNGETAGDHFTPREIIRLMVELLAIPLPEKHISIYDPACGTGGMLSVAKEHLLEKAATAQQKANVARYLTVHGQEISPTNYAICRADLLIKNDPQAQVTYGNSLIPHAAHSKEPGDQWPEQKHQFDFMLSNPPFGVAWGGKDGYGEEAEKLRSTRYRAGMPRINDGALLFLQTIIAKMKRPDKGGSRVAIIFNGSPLSNSDCGQAESEIRRWIIENDWLDAIVMLPDQLFYNTGIYTYIWLLRNEKPASHRGRVMIIDARQQFEREPKAFGNKRNRLTDAHRQWIEERYRQGWKPGYADEQVKLFTAKDFAYHKVGVVFWQTDEHDKPAMLTEPYTKSFTAANLKKELEFYDSELVFRVTMTVASATKRAELKIKPGDNVTQAFKAFCAGKPEIVAVEWTHRYYVEDDEYIAAGEDIAAFLKREIAKPIIRWSDSPQLGYEILPNKYFYRYVPPAPAKELLAEFWRLEKEAEKMLTGLTQ